MLPLNGKLLAFPSYFRLGFEATPMINTLAYFVWSVSEEEFFCNIDAWAIVTELFTVVIYECSK